MRDPIRFLRRCQARYGDVFMTRFPGLGRVVYMADPAEAKRLRKHHAGTLFVAGLFIAAFVSIPVLNLATPLFATAFMVHVHKQIVRRRESTSPPGEVGSQR